jgi:hypothetical protein
MRKGIALLITLMFIILITVAVGIGLKNINEATKLSKKDQFILQTNVLIDDVLTILRKSKELDLILSSDSEDIKREAFNIFLAQTSFIPLESSGVKMILELSSARDKINPNKSFDENLTDSNYKHRVNRFENYLQRFNVNSVEYIKVFQDLQGGYKEDMSYKSGIFNQNTTLFRDYITSLKHLEEANDYYAKSFHENSLKNIDFENIFYFSKNSDYEIDLNYATKEVWQMLLGCEDSRANQLVEGSGTYAELNDLYLSDDENLSLSYFKTSFFQPVVDVKLEIIKDEQNAKISFEYDLKTKKGSNFIYEI